MSIFSRYILAKTRFGSPFSPNSSRSGAGSSNGSSETSGLGNREPIQNRHAQTMVSPDPNRLSQRVIWWLAKRLYATLPISFLHATLAYTRKTPRLVENSLKSSDTELIQIVSRRFALHAFQRAATRVPAYRRFLESHGVDPFKVATIETFDRDVPQTRRDNYTRAYSLLDRCIDGQLPEQGAIDESAGSTGEPLNWIRCWKEVEVSKQTFQMGLRFTLGYRQERPSILLNMFSCGAWAAGFRLGTAMESWCLTKNLGPDRERVFRTLQLFGPSRHYLIAGYPPFLRELVLFLKEQPDLDLKSYRIDIMTGGEGFPESWRRLMESELRAGAKIVSGYGASDLEIGIASETPYSIGLSRLLSRDEDLRRAFLGTLREPVFLGQYNPSGHYVREVLNAAGQVELEVTVLNPHSISPRIKYCVGDEGRVIPFERVKAFVQEHDLPLRSEEIALPFLCIFGRCDGTVSIDGANIYPEVVQSALMEHPLAASHIATFKMGVTHGRSGAARLAILLRASKGTTSTLPLTQTCKEAILHKLLTVNTDFRESYRDNPASADPLVKILPFDSDLFEESTRRIKHSYFLEETYFQADLEG